MNARRRRRAKEARGGLYAPHPVHVRLDGVDGLGSRPRSVDGRRVESVREEWLVEDRWWSGEPLRRHYLELVLESGRCTVVYRDLAAGGWYEQR
jgi:hypothetical protein